MIYYLLLLSAACIIITLLYASWRDLKERRVPFKTWYPMLAVGIPVALFTYVSLLFGDGTAGSIAFGYIFLVAMFCFMFYFSSAYLHMFGGADAWAFIFITALLPIYPAEPLLGYPYIAFLPLSVLVNAVILNLFVPVGLLIFNICKGNKAPIFYRLVGYPVKGDEITEAFGFVMEEFEECEKTPENPDGLIRRYIKFGSSMKRMVKGGSGRMYTGDLKKNPQEYKKELALYKKAGHVWISFGVPFIVPITAGLILALFVGDILQIIIRLITGAL